MIHPNGTGEYESRWISLRYAVEVSTGYRGRGLEPLAKILPVGTRVHYCKSVNHTDGPEVWVHVITYTEGRDKYAAVVRTPRQAAATDQVAP